MKNKLMLGGTLLVAAFFAIGSVSARAVRSGSTSASVTSPLTKTSVTSQPSSTGVKEEQAKVEQVVPKQQETPISTPIEPAKPTIINGPTLKTLQDSQVAAVETGVTTQGLYDKMKSWWAGKNTAEALVQTTPWAALAAGMAGVSITPIIAVGLGGAAATYAVSTALDQVNFVQKSGGYFTKSTLKNRLKEDMALILNDQGAYPYIISRVEAIDLNNEIYPVNKDEFGIAKEIMAEMREKIVSSSKSIDIKTQEKEDKFAGARDTLRTQHNYKTATSDQYIARLEAGDDLIKAQALVSEYSRARNRKKIEELQVSKPEDKNVVQ